MRTPAIGLTLLALAACTRPEPPPLEVVQGFDAERYLGTWHEIATIPAWFQEQCVTDTTATYSPAPEPGWIKVVNACRTASGEMDAAEARARFTGAPGEARLEVTFVDLLGWWVWPIAGKYEVIALDPGYGWSLVAHPSRDYAWILSRSPRLDDATLLELRAKLDAVGYNPCRLVLTAAEDPRRGRSLCAI